MVNILYRELNLYVHLCYAIGRKIGLGQFPASYNMHLMSVTHYGPFSYIMQHSQEASVNLRSWPGL